eukprot:g3140.t1
MRIPHAYNEFRRLVLRRTASNFKKRYNDGILTQLPKGSVERCLTLAQRAPSSFNVQPWECVIVRDESLLSQLSTHAMIGQSNQERVKRCPVTCVFLADLNPSERIPEIQKLMRTEYRERMQGDKELPPTTTLSEKQLRDFAFNVQLFTGKNDHQSPGLHDILSMGIGFKDDLFPEINEMKVEESSQEESKGGQDEGLTNRENSRDDDGTIQEYQDSISMAPPLPNMNYPTSTWAFKNAMFAVQTFLLAACAHNLDCYPMEGFDEKRVKESLNIPPQRFGIPVIVPIAYSPDSKDSESVEEPAEALQPSSTSRRLSPSSIFHENRYGTALTNPELFVI